VAGEHGPGEQDAQAEREAPAGRFEDLVDELVGCEGVTPPRGGSGFGRSALRWEKRIFAMLVRGRLVVKLAARESTGWSPAATGCASTRTRAQPRSF
jgi:hypothetical protein